MTRRHEDDIVEVIKNLTKPVRTADFSVLVTLLLRCGCGGGCVTSTYVGHALQEDQKAAEPSVSAAGSFQAESLQPGAQHATTHMIE